MKVCTADFGLGKRITGEVVAKNARTVQMRLLTGLPTEGIPTPTKKEKGKGPVTVKRHIQKHNVRFLED